MTFELPLETDRLTIRPFDPDHDLEPMLAVYGDPKVMRYIPGGVQDRDAVRATLEEQVRRHEERAFAYWALVERASGSVIGDAGFGVFSQTGDVEIGWTLARSRWGRGYATEAGRACLDAAEALAVPRVIAVIDCENAPSIRVASRLGMELTDETAVVAERPHAIYAQHFLLR